MRRASWLLLTVGLALSACGGEGDDGGEGEGGGSAGSGDSSDGSAGSSGGQDERGANLDGDALVSSLSDDELGALCDTLQDRKTLAGDLEQSCEFEAYLLTFDPAECTQIVSQCTSAGETALGIELPVDCGGLLELASGCDIRVDEMLECEETFDRFAAARQCTTELLDEEPPGCVDALAPRCTLYQSTTPDEGNGSGSSGGGGVGSCSGVTSSCFAQFGSLSCTSLDGCIWSSVNNSCSGAARPCSSYLTAGACALQTGCFWSNF